MLSWTSGLGPLDFRAEVEDLETSLFEHSKTLSLTIWIIIANCQCSAGPLLWGLAVSQVAIAFRVSYIFLTIISSTTGNKVLS